MKPNWDMAPPWAEYAAQEMSGTWFWHSRKPRFISILGEWKSDGQTAVIPKVELPAQATLEVRP